MPVKQIGPRQPSPMAGQLAQRLIAEWNSPQGTSAQPVIVEEHDAVGRLIHVYVVWDEWSNLEADERSEIVLDACEKVKGRTATLDLTIAMGLTSLEADRLRIPYH